MKGHSGLGSNDHPLKTIQYNTMDIMKIWITITSVKISGNILHFQKVVLMINDVLISQKPLIMKECTFLQHVYVHSSIYQKFL